MVMREETLGRLDGGGEWGGGGGGGGGGGIEDGKH